MPTLLQTIPVAVATTEANSIVALTIVRRDYYEEREPTGEEQFVARMMGIVVPSSYLKKRHEIWLSQDIADACDAAYALGGWPAIMALMEPV